MSRTINTNNILNNYQVRNSKLFEANNSNIQRILQYYKPYNLIDELKQVKNENKEIISEKTLIPDLVSKSQVFDRNLCFYRADGEILRKNGFSRDNLAKNINNGLNEENGSSSDSKNSFDNSERKSGSSNNEYISEVEDDDDNYDKAQRFIKNYKVNNCNLQEIQYEKNFMINLIQLPKEDIIYFIKEIGGNSQIQNEQKGIIKQLFENNMNREGWLVYPNKFNSFELYEFLVRGIEENVKIDYIPISNDITNDRFLGGQFFFYLKELFEQYFNSPNNNYNNNYNQIEFEEQLIPLSLLNIISNASDRGFHENNNNNNNFTHNNINNRNNNFNNMNINQMFNYFPGEMNHSNNNTSDFGF